MRRQAHKGREGPNGIFACTHARTHARKHPLKPGARYFGPVRILAASAKKARRDPLRRAGSHLSGAAGKLALRPVQGSSHIARFPSAQSTHTSQSKTTRAVQRRMHGCYTRTRARTHARTHARTRTQRHAQAQTPRARAQTRSCGLLRAAGRAGAPLHVCNCSCICCVLPTDVGRILDQDLHEVPRGQLHARRCRTRCDTALRDDSSLCGESAQLPAPMWAG